MASLVVNVSSLFYSQILLINNDLYCFSTAGNTVGCDIYSTTGTTVNLSFITGYGTAYGRSSFYSNNIYIPSYSQNRLIKYSSNGVLDSGYTLNVSAPIANTILNDVYYVSSYPSTVIQTFNITNGASINSSFISNVNGIIGAMVAKDTLLYVATENGIISVFNATTGAVINSSFITGTSTTPYGITCDSKYLYLADFNGGNVNLYDRISGVNITLVSGYTSVRGLAFDSSYLYFSLQTTGAVYKISNPYYTPDYSIGTAPTINSITITSNTFNVNFTPGTGGNPAPTTYFYSLNGGAYTNANSTTSPILITGLSFGVNYNVTLIANNLGGNTVASNVVVGFIPYPVGSAPTITSITNNTPTSISVFFTPGTGGTPAPTTYFYSLNGGAYTNANSTTSPILITGLSSGINYNVTLIANNLGGNTVASNVVVGFIPYPCFLQGTKILRLNVETDEEEYVAVEKLRRGDLITTYNHGYKAIELIGSKVIPRPLDISKPSSRLYWFRKSRIPRLREDLCVTGDHCILHKMISTEKKHQVFAYMGDIFITEDHYRVPAFLDDRAESYENADAATIWHFALENPNIYHNYGVMANGILVESSSLHYMYKYSNMKMV